MQLTIALTKDTPFEVLLETSTYITNVAHILHREEDISTAVARVKDAPPPVPADNVVQLRPQPYANTVELHTAKHTEADPKELDVDGYPWDSRIHAAGRGKTSNGQWRKRRNTSDERVAQVEAELRNKLARMALNMDDAPKPLAVSAPTVRDVPLPPEPSMLTLPPMPLLPSELPPVVATVAPPPPTATELPPASPAALSAPTERSFDEVMALVTDVLVGEMLVEEDVQRILTDFDLKELADLASKTPATVALVYNAIEQAAK